jgi:hypothetical protein
MIEDYADQLGRSKQEARLVYVFGLLCGSEHGDRILLGQLPKLCGTTRRHIIYSYIQLSQIQDRSPFSKYTLYISNF